MLCWPEPIVVVLVTVAVLLPVVLKTLIRRFAPHLIAPAAPPAPLAQRRPPLRQAA